MHPVALLPLLSALTGLAAAQGFNISAVPIATRSQWCTDQKTSCPLLCLQYGGDDLTTASNDCDPETLIYSCVCENGLSPNSSEYSLTVPYYECTQRNTECVANCGLSNNACASACRENNPCGAQDPQRVNATSSSSTSSSMTQTATTTDPAATSGTDGGDGSAETTYATLGGGAAPTGDAGAGTDASGNSAATSLFEYGRSYGMAAVLGSVFAGFALVM